MTEFAEKARTIGVSLRRGESRRKKVINDQDGSQAGYEVEHWDDHQDVVAQPTTIKATFKAGHEEE